MCPMCWATAIAAFVVYLCVTTIVVVGRDIATVMVGVVLGGSGLLQKIGDEIFLPWWWYVGVSVLLLCRVLYLLVRARDQLLVVMVWRRAVDWAIAFRKRKRTL